jgi:hypothetical protein
MARAEPPIRVTLVIDTVHFGQCSTAISTFHTCSRGARVGTRRAPGSRRFHTCSRGARIALLDLLATGDRAGVDEAFERYLTGFDDRCSLPNASAE